MKTINIALAADNNYAQHVAVVIESILENTEETNKVRFFLLSDGITAEKLQVYNRQLMVRTQNWSFAICRHTRALKSCIQADISVRLHILD